LVGGKQGGAVFGWTAYVQPGVRESRKMMNNEIVKLLNGCMEKWANHRCRPAAWPEKKLMKRVRKAAKTIQKGERWFGFVRLFSGGRGAEVRPQPFLRKGWVLAQLANVEWGAIVAPRNWGPKCRLVSPCVASQPKSFFPDGMLSMEQKNRESREFLMPVLRTSGSSAYRGYKDAAPDGALELRPFAENHYKIVAERVRWSAFVRESPPLSAFVRLLPGSFF
jgi:hypothetical protein